jgi:catechol 2,3-dioxygenase-like lactoylglutathione lyase family enzyme
MGILGLQKIKASSLNEDLTKQIFDTACECQIILYGNENFAVEVFVDASAAGKTNPFVHLCLEVEEREEFLGKCLSAGLVVNRVQKGNSQLVFVEDYNGNLFEIKELSD